MGRRIVKSKSELYCKRLLEVSYFPGYKFRNVRPKWLINDKTQQPMELDLYNAQLNLAVEYNGEQHYHLVDGMNDPVTLKEQRYRDRLKRKLCKERGINLIVVKYDVDIPEYLYKKLTSLGYIKY